MNRYTKNLICAYCESNNEESFKCEACELNPTHGINFQLGNAAKVAIARA